MSEEFRSMVTGVSALYLIAVMALILTFNRRLEKPDPAQFDRFIFLYLFGISCQCLHFTEEMLTGFHHQFPTFLGLTPWSIEFFVTLNVTFIALFVLAGVGILKQIRAAYFLVWFFILAGIVNIIAHPLLALVTLDYFPGLFTAPIVGLIGFALAARLWKLTSNHLNRRNLKS